jgi:hypothetical protein
MIVVLGTGLSIPGRMPVSDYKYKLASFCGL